MDERQRQILLKIARDTVRAVVTGYEAALSGSPDSSRRSLSEAEAQRAETEPELNAPCGCFVTLKNGDRLRGCIGQFTSDRPLFELVGEMAKASAASDPRFAADRITADELQELDLEISVLSPLKKTDDPLSLRLGVDGIYIKKGFASGCFLPQVATETGWSKEEFLSYCCSHKAGLPADAWKDDQTEVFLFTAEVFGAAFNEIE